MPCGSNKYDFCSQVNWVNNVGRTHLMSIPALRRVLIGGERTTNSAVPMWMWSWLSRYHEKDLCLMPNSIDAMSRKGCFRNSRQLSVSFACLIVKCFLYFCWLSLCVPKIWGQHSLPPVSMAGPCYSFVLENPTLLNILTPKQHVFSSVAQPHIWLRYASCMS